MPHTDPLSHQLGGSDRPGEARPSPASSWLVPAAITVAFGAWMHWQPGGGSLAVEVDDVTELATAAVAAIVCVRRGTRPWILLGGYAAVWATGQATWTFYELVLHRAVPFPSLADVGYIAAVPLGIAALVCFGRTSGPWRNARLIADCMVVGLALGAVAWSEIMGPLTRTSGYTGPSAVLLLAYPITDVAMLSLILPMLARSERGRNNVPLLVGAGLAAIALADAMFAYLNATLRFQTGNVIDAAYVAGFCLIAAGALRPPPPRRREDVGPMPTFAGLGLVYAPLVVLMVDAAAQQRSRGAVRPELIWMGLAVVTTLLARQVLLLAELRDRERGLLVQARFDPLTQLPNRVYLRELLEDALDTGAGHAAVLLIDLDNFKSVNDGLGHPVGNNVLLEVSERVSSCVRPGDVAARVGGDEFAVLLADSPSAEQALVVARGLREAIRRRLCVGGADVHVSASIGLALQGGRRVTAEALIHSADLAMHVAKRNGRDRFEIFEPAMQSTAIDRISLSADLRRALDVDEFVVHYQPQVDLVTGAIKGAEALVRWEHPEKGTVPPLDFIPLAEETGLVLPLGRLVLEHACRQTRQWLREGVVDASFEISVNLSARQFRDERLVTDVLRILEDTGVPAGMLVLEITESVFAEPEAAAACIGSLKAQGLRIAVDDFGTGYSSLGYLRRLPIDILKIDRSFVMGLDLGPEEAVLPRAIIHLADDLGLGTIAEGVETERQQDELVALGCPTAQGYLFSKPVPAQEFAGYVERARKGRLRVSGPTVSDFGVWPLAPGSDAPH